MDIISVAFSKVFQRVVRFRCPLYVTPSVSEGLSDHPSASAEYRKWGLIPAREAHHGGNGDLPFLGWQRRGILIVFAVDGDARGYLRYRMPWGRSR